MASCVKHDFVPTGAGSVICNICEKVVVLPMPAGWLAAHHGSGLSPNAVLGGAGDGRGGHGGASSTAGSKRRRAIITDESRTFLLALLDTPLQEMATAEDVRRVLAEPLRATVLVAEDYVQLILACEGIIPLKILEMDHDSSMSRLCTLLHFVHEINVTSGSEDVWARVADNCTGNVWRTLTALHGAFPFRDDRNRSDASDATVRSLRPGYTGYVSGALLITKAEHKGSPSELQSALQELVTKMNGGWNPLAMRGLPFLPCYAIGGELLQFAVVLPPTGGAVMRIVTVSDEFVLTSPQGRLGAVKAACNMYRIIVWLRGQLPQDAVPLYVEQNRADGGSITVYDNHVVKLTHTIASPDVYTAVAQIPHAIRITDVMRPRCGVGLCRLHLEPVALERKPRDERELKDALRCVLGALAAFHHCGFFLHDVRWPNVLFTAEGSWILADFELAGAIGSIALPRAINPTYLPPEARTEGSLYASSVDVWQVGQLVLCAFLQILSAAGADFAKKLTAELPDERPSAAAALAMDWLRV